MEESLLAHAYGFIVSVFDSLSYLGYIGLYSYLLGGC
jgi:hypothetical protein